MIYSALTYKNVEVIGYLLVARNYRPNGKESYWIITNANGNGGWLTVGRRYRVKKYSLKLVKGLESLI